MLVCHASLCVLTAYETSPAERTYFEDSFDDSLAFIVELKAQFSPD